MNINTLLGKHRFKITTGIFILAGLLAAWLLYQNYLKPAYELSNLLPADFQISFELRNDRLTFPKIQQEKILKYPLFKELYQEIVGNVELELAKWPSELKTIAQTAEHSLLFFKSPQAYGLLFKISDKRQLKQAAAAEINGWSKTIIKKQVLVLTSSPELLQEITAEKTFSSVRPAYLSLTVNPWLKVNFQNSFFAAKYQEPILNDLQSILWPLSLNQNNYSLTLDSDAYSLILNLTPEQKTAPEQPADLKPFLPDLLKEADLAVGLADNLELQKALENNENLRKLWHDFDSHLWISSQLSLSSLFKQLKYPLLFSQKGDQWQILTISENKDILEHHLKAYLAQFMPKETRKVLPDGTLAVELIADLSKIQWEAENINDWQVFNYPTLNLGESQPGFAVKDNLFIISNKIKPFNLSPLELKCSFSENSAINGFFMLKPVVSWLKLAENLKNFSNITAISSPDGEIKVCLGL